MAADNEIKVLLTADLAGLKAGMDAAAESVAVSSEAMTAAATESAAAINAAHVSLGETAEQAAARIKAMVAASMEQAAANAKLGESERSLAERAGLRVEATDAQLDATAAAIAAQNEQMAAASALAEAEESVAVSTGSATVALEANTEAMVINGGVARELGVLTGEAVRGNWTRLEGSTITLANRMNLLQYAFSPLGLAIGAAALVVGGFTHEIYKAEEQADELNRTLLSTGGTLGLTAGQFNLMVPSVEKVGGSSDDAREALIKLAASGKESGDQLEESAQGAVAFARLTGQSMDQAVAAILKLEDKPTKALLDLNNHYHFLSAAQFEHVQQLEEEGRATDAATEAVRLFAEASKTRLKEADQNVGILIRSWRELGKEVGIVGKALGSIGRPETAENQYQYARTMHDNYASLARREAAAGDTKAAQEDQYAAAQWGIAADKWQHAVRLQHAALQERNKAQSAEDVKIAEAAKPEGKPKSAGRASPSQAETQSLQEQLSIQESLEQVSYDNRTQFELKFWQDKLATLKQGTAAYAQAYAQVANLEHQVEQQRQQSAAAAARVQQQELAQQERHNQQMAALNRKAALDNQKMWQERLRPISQAFQGVINGFIQGTLTWRQATQRVLQSVAAEYIQKGIEITVNHAANEMAKTTATAAGAAARTTIEATAAAQSKATDAATGRSQITSAAATGAAKAYQAIVGIPYVGPILAPIAAGVAFAGIEAFSGSLASARGGWERVPIDGAMTELHKDEMVLPANIANPMRQMAKQGGQGGQPIHIHAADARSFKDWSRRNMGDFANTLKLAQRRGHFSR
jgi:hypothetical protein